MTTTARAQQIRQELVDFVLDAEGDLAVALEAFSADQLSRMSKSPVQGASLNELVIDTFVVEGRVGAESPIDRFMAASPNLSPADRTLLSHWRQGFTGLFAVTEVLPDGLKLMNWTTAKSYLVQPNGTEPAEKLNRLKEGEILLTRILPIDEAKWMISTSLTLLGKLGKPKLAVAIGNFKDNFKSQLYADAPDLLEEAWRSVEQYHQDFLDFFGSDEVTLSGYELDKKMAQFQEQMTQRRLEASGVDSSKSLQELAEEAGVSQEEVAEAAEELGADANTVKQLLENKPGKTKMMTPQLKLPDHLRKAPEVTVLAHPRWGQYLLTNYTQFKTLLTTPEDQIEPSQAESLVQHYLKEPTIGTYVWQRLAQEHPQQLENLLQQVLQQPNFQLDELDTLLKSHGKPMKPELPEIASVPLHLHNLFEEALAEVQKTKSKNKGKQKPSKGFQR